MVNRLYHDIPLQCATCGLRFFDKEKMGKHLDWHFTMNSKQKQKSKKAISRTWYLTSEVSCFLLFLLVGVKCGNNLAFRNGSLAWKLKANQVYLPFSFPSSCIHYYIIV